MRATRQTHQNYLNLFVVVVVVVVAASSIDVPCLLPAADDADVGPQEGSTDDWAESYLQGYHR